MVIETNYENPDDHVPEAKMNNRGIKESFQIAYYQLPYTNISRVMIRHLSMNVTQNLDLFPAKVGVSDHYIPQMIL